MRYYRQGDWKILRMPVPYGSGDWQLFNLTTDPGELHDVSVRYPKFYQQLVSAWQEYAKVNGVVEPDTPMLYSMPTREK